MSATGPTAWRLEVFERLASTSDLCIERAEGGAPAGLAVLALQQSAGRGSRGRDWRSPAGNLYLSVLLRPGLPAAAAGFFPLLAGNAVADAIAEMLPGAAPALKWPNDVLLSGGKLAGILLDAAPGAAAPGAAALDWLVIGIGINLAEAPAIPGRSTTSLAEHGGAVTPLAAAEILLRHLDIWLRRLAEAGVAPVLAAWQQKGHPVGSELALHSPGGSVTGRFAGLSPQGELLLQRGNRIERFRTGEVLPGAES